jgi:hypothetical protein
MKILIIILLLTKITFSQNFEMKGNSVLDNKGKVNINNRYVNVENGSNINNSGTINIEKQYLNSDGIINNENGKLLLNNTTTTTFNQKEIKGYVEFNSANRQYIPAILFDTIVFKGNEKQFIVNSRTNEVDFGATSLVKTDATSNITYDKLNPMIPKFYSHKSTEHDGKINANSANSDGVPFILSTDSTFAQINGTGLFKSLELDKANGATITRGGWSVQNLLTLRNGVLYNSNDQNFTLENGSTINIVDGNFHMMDESGIYRTPQSRLNMAPIFDGKVLVEYGGTGGIEIGGEIPLANNVLTDLIVNNSEGVTFTRDAHVSDRLTVASNIYMDSDSDGNGTKDKENTLVFKGQNSGIDYTNQTAEIYGNFARTNLVEGESQTFNNAYTWVKFGNGGQDLSNNSGKIDTFQVRIEPNTAFDIIEYDEDSEFKVRRKIELTAKDNSGNQIDSVNDVTFGYAWKHDKDNVNNPLHETSTNPDVIFNELVLQKWEKDDIDWVDQTDATNPQLDNNTKFAYASAKLNGRLGEFGIGMTIAKYLALMAKAILEGAYIGEGKMHTVLSDSLIIPNTPPGEYPFNLDPNSKNIYVENIPEGVVDWIVLEFRDGPNIASNNKFYKTCFLMSDGTIADTNGSSQVLIFSEDTGINVKGGDGYHLALRHRNHLTVVTNDKFMFSTKEATQIIDFSDPNVIFGFDLKVLGLDEEGNQVRGLYAGNVDRSRTYIDSLTGVATGEQYISNDDVDFIAKFLGDWDLNPKAMYRISDTNMNGIITGKDYNISWNNRGKISVVIE